MRNKSTKIVIAIIMLSIIFNFSNVAETSPTEERHFAYVLNVQLSESLNTLSF